MSLRVGTACLAHYLAMQRTCHDRFHYEKYVSFSERRQGRPCTSTRALDEQPHPSSTSVIDGRDHIDRPAERSNDASHNLHVASSIAL